MKLSKKVQAVCLAENISQTEIEYMCKMAALCSEDGFNRRFHQWLLDIREDQCHNIAVSHITAVGSLSGNGWVEEEHLDCDGQGCRVCGWRGRVVRYF